MPNANYFATPTVNTSSTANVRSIGAEINAAFAAASLSRTSDTGQVDWTTVTAPAVNVVIGYEVWSICGGSLKLRLEYKMPAATTSVILIKSTVGTGTDGAGNITGVLYTGLYNTPAQTPSAGNLDSWVSNPAAGDFFGFIFKRAGGTSGGLQNASIFTLLVEKIPGADGLPDGSGYVFTDQDEGGGTTRLSVAKKAVNVGGGTYTASGQGNFSIVPFGATSSVVGSDKQAFLHQFPTPRIKFGLGVCTVIASEYSVNTTFSTNLIGPTNRGYISVGYSLGGPHGSSNAQTWSVAMLWEP